MDMYLIGAGGTLHFPVNPETINLTIEKSFETHNIIYKGEKDFLHKDAKKIRGLKFKALFPREYDTFCRYVQIDTPEAYIQILEDIIDAEEFPRLIITDLDLNAQVNLAKVNLGMDAQYNGDKIVDLEFRIVTGTPSNEGKKTIQREANTTNLPRLKDNRPEEAQEKTYTIKKGDTAYKAAKKMTGNGADYNAVLEANPKAAEKLKPKLAIQDNLFPVADAAGLKLVYPPKSAERPATTRAVTPTPRTPAPKNINMRVNSATKTKSAPTTPIKPRNFGGE